MIQRCFALPYYVYCLRLRCLVSFLFYSTINGNGCFSKSIPFGTKRQNADGMKWLQPHLEPEQEHRIK
ncbi:Uncharacterised protein [Neisseria animalis]|nr:Uncharacterised protein [Neisseria animalis]